MVRSHLKLLIRSEIRFIPEKLTVSDGTVVMVVRQHMW